MTMSWIACNTILASPRATQVVEKVLELMLEKHSTCTVQDRPLEGGVDEPIMTSSETSSTDITVLQFKEIHPL